MIDKITPRALDKSSDYKLVPKTSMIDALNVFITDDNVDEEGNAGVLKNIKGNRNIMYASLQDRPQYSSVALKVIGSVTDTKTQICYFFVWSQEPADHGIWAYDKYGKLPISKFEAQGIPNTLRKIYTSAQFNFPEHGFVKGDVVYTNTNEFEKHKKIEDYLNQNLNLKVDFEKDALLYFTDYHNEPRKINAYRALLDKTDNFQGYTAFDTADLICACPKVALERITFEFTPDGDVSVNNFTATPGFQFAYQKIYKDGMESAISTYSTIAFPPSVIHRGAAQDSNILAHNLCTLTVPRMGPEIENIRILARYGNSANFFEIDEVGNLESNTANWDPVNRTYKFYNDRVASGVSPQEVDKTFDNLPRKAQAQTAIANRLVYGNYLEGYDNVDTECESTVIYNERPQDFLDLIVKIHPSIEPSDPTKHGNNKSAGFIIDTTEIPNEIPEGTTIHVSLDYTPDRNFHIYQANESRSSYGTYHQTRHLGAHSANAVGYRHWPLTGDNNLYYDEGEDANLDGQNDTHENSNADYQESGGGSGSQDQWFGGPDNGEVFLHDKAEPFFGQNFGVGSENDFTGANLPKWHLTNINGFNDPEHYLDTGNNVRYGTSAGNPLIIKGAPLHFELKFSITQDILWEGKKIMRATIAEALAGANGIAISQSGGTGAFSYPDVINIDEIVNNRIHTVKIEKNDYDLGLGHGETDFLNVPNFSFPRIAPGKPLSYLVCGAGNMENLDQRPPEDEVEAPDVFNDLLDGSEFLFGCNTHELIPWGYFIINKAEVDFYLELVDESIHQEHSGHLRLAISKIDVDEEDVMTCFKRLDPTSPWWAINPKTIQHVDFNKHFKPAQGSEALNDDVIWDTTADTWESSLPYKFNLPSPILYEGIPTSTHIRSWFTAKFDLNEEATGWDGDFGDSSKIPVNIGFCGYLDVSQAGHELYKPHNPNGDYVPITGGGNGQRFKFSLMDGEGGPGGSSAGANSAYDKYGNSEYGSIAARVDVGYDGSSIVLRKGLFSLDNTHFLYQALVGGSSTDEDGILISETYSGGPSGVTQAIGEALQMEEQPQNPGFYREKYVLSGPFFTGSIAMNPVIGATPDVANLYAFPPVKDYTTTLPLVWVKGKGKELRNSSNDIKKNWLKTSYPWPQVIKPTGFVDILNSNGLIADGELDLTPFSNPVNYPVGQSGVGDPSSMDVPDDSPPATSAFGCVDFSLLHSHIEGNTQSSFSFGGDQGYMSFKSSATHEIGIVYYDERGRHGFVNHLDSVYVEGYSDQDRGDLSSQGSAHILLKLLHDPPEWAHNYKIVYSKNTTVSDFIQYSSGGAFVATGNSTSGDPSRIYVSLNYLQGHIISYSSAWGARSQEGSMVLYTPQDGDRLRVVSYMLPPHNDEVPVRVYPTNYDFEVSGVVSLDGSEENPLRLSVDGVLTYPENRQGLFLKLKNNNGAHGFRYEDVRDASHHWGDNCLIEIYSPVKELDPEDRLYYEIGDTYRTVRTEEGQLLHEVNEILLTEGDVYFRSAAVNFRDYDNGNQEYQDIIIDSDYNLNDFNASESNFKSYYIESPSGTDLFKSDGLSIGRPNIIKHDAQEAYKEASVIHSDRDITDARKVSYSAFNRSIPIDKDLDLKSGGINYLANHNENCFFIQKDKCGYIPIDRSIISDVEGETSLIASSKFLNTPKYYAGRAGADGNPESVVNIDNTAYFAHKSLGEVYRVSGVNGVNVISENNMTSYFRELFKDAINQSMFNGEDVRVVGGYDPVKNEYLVTVLDPVTYGLDKEPDFPDQPVDDPIISDVVLGCTDPQASNYNPDATHNNGSCLYIENVRKGCTDPLALNYNPNAIVDDGSCLYEDTDVEPYSGHPCEYDMLKDEEGDITIESVTAAWEEANAMLASGEITQYQASQIFPDFNGDGVISVADFNATLILWPLSCDDSEYDPDFEVDISWNSSSRTSGVPFETPQYFSHLYIGDDYEGCFPGQDCSNTELCCPGFLHPLSPLPQPKQFSLVINDVSHIQKGESIEITLSIPALEESITYSDPLSSSFEYAGDDYETLFNLGPGLFLSSNFGTSTSLNNNREYRIVMEGDRIQAYLESLNDENGEGSSDDENGYFDPNGPVDDSDIGKNRALEALSGYDPRLDTYTVSNYLFSPWGTEGWLSGLLGAFYPPPDNLLGPRLNEDVQRNNKLNVSVVYKSIDKPTTLRSCSLRSDIGWSNSEFGAEVGGSNVAKSRQLVEPLLFTGDFCDYPEMMDYISNASTAGIIGNGTIQEYYNIICARIEDPEDPLTANEATYLFPNFPGAIVQGGAPSSGMTQSQWLEYFNNNNGMGNLDLNDYDEGQGIEWLVAAPQGYSGSDNWAAQAWRAYSMQNVWGPNDLNANGQAAVTSVCPQPCAYDNNPCDYPLIINDQGIIDFDSINAAAQEVFAMINAGELTQLLATCLFPDVNNNGVFDLFAADQFIALTTDVILGQENAPITVNNTLFCNQNPCPYTGNPCDYPMLIDNFFMSPTLGMITGQSLTHASHTIFDQINNNEITAIQATCFYPDIYENEYISASDLIYILPGLPYDCTEGGEPPPGGPVKPIKNDVVKPAIRARVTERRKKNKEEDKENY